MLWQKSTQATLFARLPTVNARGLASEVVAPYAHFLWPFNAVSDLSWPESTEIYLLPQQLNTIKESSSEIVPFVNVLQTPICVPRVSPCSCGTACPEGYLHPFLLFSCKTACPEGHVHPFLLFQATLPLPKILLL
jgi:hypothetical protein